jgi:hypothetical protein
VTGADDQPEEISWEHLALLQAGAFGIDQARALRRRISSDPDALARLGALDQLRAELLALPQQDVPPDVIARVNAALGEERRPSRDRRPEATSPDTGLSLDLRWRTVGASLVVALVVALALVVVARTSPTPVGSPLPPPTAAPEVTASRLATLYPEVLRHHDFGFLSDPSRLASCAPPYIYRSILAAMPLKVDGREGVLLAFTRPFDERVVRLTVYGPSCLVTNATPAGASEELATTDVPL